MYLCASVEESFTFVRYLLVAGGQVLNTGVAKRFIRSALWEEGEPHPRMIQVDRCFLVSVHVLHFQEQLCIYETCVTTNYKLMT